MCFAQSYPIIPTHNKTHQHSTKLFWSFKNPHNLYRLLTFRSWICNLQSTFDAIRMESWDSLTLPKKGGTHQNYSRGRQEINNTDPYESTTPKDSIWSLICCFYKKFCSSIWYAYSWVLQESLIKIWAFIDILLVLHVK